MGGLKKKIAIEKIENKQYRAVTFSKRREGLYSKSAQFCQRSDDQMAILVAPLSDESNVSFYSFGHSSVDAVVNAFLANERPPPPPRDEKLGFWWDDESVANSDNPDLLSEAVDSITEMLHDIKELGKQRDCEDLKKNKKKKNDNKNKNKKNKKKGFSHGTQQTQPVNPEPSSANQTLTHGPCSTIPQDNINLGFEGLYNNNNEEGILTGYDNGGTHQNQTLIHELCSAIPQDDMNLGFEAFCKYSNEERAMTAYDNGGCNEEEIDLDQVNYTFDPEFDLDQVPLGGDGGL